MKKLFAILIVGAFMSAALVGCLGEQNEELYIYHAGSLSIPFDELEQRFEENNSDIDVRCEGAGSVATVRKVTDQGKEPDIVAVADYTLIPSMMYEEGYADWTVRFAQNRMVIAHTDASAHVDTINTTNWFEILSMDDVKFGFSNPNDDPCGYRSQMVTLLAEDYYGNSSIFNELIEAHSAIQAEGYNITVPETQEMDIDTDKIMMRSAEVDLMSALEAGEIDYLFIYQSVAQQHEGVEFTQLPREIDLSSVEFADNYGKVQLTRASGDVAVGKPIVYGITISSTAKNEEGAIAFLEFLFQETGLGVMESMGQPPIDPPEVDNIDNMPDGLQDLVVEG